MGIKSGTTYIIATGVLIKHDRRAKRTKIPLTIIKKN
jgi:hypothetical protein